MHTFKKKYAPNICILFRSEGPDLITVAKVPVYLREFLVKFLRLGKFSDMNHKS
jgi:hypothetical protein